ASLGFLAHENGIAGAAVEECAIEGRDRVIGAENGLCHESLPLQKKISSSYQRWPPGCANTLSGASTRTEPTSFIHKFAPCLPGYGAAAYGRSDRTRRTLGANLERSLAGHVRLL